MRYAGLVCSGFTAAALVASSSAFAHTHLDNHADEAEFKVLVFSKTAGFRHASIPDGIACIEKLGEKHHFAVDATEDSAQFTDDNLKQYATVIFLSTTGDILNDEQQSAFENYIKNGGGYFGIHAAADTEYDWPWYGKLVGGYFKSHPRIQDATILVADRTHPSTRHLPQKWDRKDEWYNYRESPRGSVHVLMTLDEKTYEGGSMPDDHPIAWCHEFEGGRSFYTGGGHTKESFTEDEFVQHLLGAIMWTAGSEEADAGASIGTHFEKVILDDNVTDPMELAVTSDGRVIFVERGGAIKVWLPQSQTTVQAGFIAVSTAIEDGLLGVTIDPEFDDNGRIYIYYSPAGDEPVQHLSRLTLNANNEIDLDSEIIMMEVPTQRDECCHSGGSLTFGPDGCLYISTGDNTNPFGSDGYAPIDERPGRGPWDAQKSSANRSDLRGKVLRIRPLANGEYEIPEGNLFPMDGSAGRPEIYVMGCRNPFRIAVDQQRGWLYWGDVGPDAGGPRENRGPAGHDEYNQTRSAGNFGWPLFVGENLAYYDYDFATQASGPLFDPAAPLNDSPNNTGAQELPPATPAWIAYPYGDSKEWPVLGSGGRCAMAGPTYYIDDVVSPSTGTLPAYFDDTVFLYEWARNAIFEVKLDEENGQPLVMNRFMPETMFIRPHDMELGPDGCLYVIEWGSNFGGGNTDSLLSRIEYNPGGYRPPVAKMHASVTSGGVPLQVKFSSEGSAARSEDESERPRLGRLTFAWDFDEDGAADSTDASPLHLFESRGSHQARLTVTDVHGASASTSVTIHVGNTAPLVQFLAPPDGGMFDWGDRIEYRLYVNDVEDEAFDAARLEVTPSLGKDTHVRKGEVSHALAGSVATHLEEGTKSTENVFQVIDARYTDSGSGRGDNHDRPQSTLARIKLRPKTLQAEFADERSGPSVTDTSDPRGGGLAIDFWEEGQFIRYSPISLYNMDTVSARATARGEGGVLELRVDAPDGPMVGKIDIRPQGLPTLTAGVHDVRIEFFENGGGAGLILRVSGPEIAKQVVPAEWFSHGDANEPGLHVDYYDVGSPGALPDFSTLTPLSSDVVSTMDWPSTNDAFATSGRADHVGAVFTGKINIPRDGVWTFFLESDDGSRLFVDDEQLVANDGLHAMQEKTTSEVWFDTPATSPLRDPGGTHDLYVVFKPHVWSGCRVKLNWLQFEGNGVAAK